MRFAASSRVQRASLIAAIGLGVLSVTGCAYINQQATTLVYSASDGVRADVGDVQLRNILVISKGKDAPGRVIGAVFNTSAKDIKVTFSGSNGSQTQILVPARSQYYLNSDNDSSILGSVSGLPGTLEQLKVSQDGTKSPASTELKVPVLDGTLQEYKPYVPSPSPSSSPRSSSAATGSAGATSGASTGATASPSASSPAGNSADPSASATATP